MNTETLKAWAAQLEGRIAANEKTAARLTGDGDAEFRAEFAQMVSLDKAMLDSVKKAIDHAAREEEPEWRQLTSAVTTADYIPAALRDGAVEGRAAEINKELGLTDRHMPYAALLDDEARVEMRQDADVAVVDAAKGKPRMSVIPRVFRRSDAAFCGVMFPSAPRGLPIYPVFTSGAAGAMAAPGDGVDAETTTFTGTMIEPTRATANYLLRVEDAAQFADLESLLRADLRAALNKLMDDAVVSLDANSPNPGSIISHATGAPAADPAAVATLSDLDTAFVDGIDGLYAYARAGVRLLHGIELEKYLGKTRHTEVPDTYAEILGRSGGMRRATSRIPKDQPSANIERAYRLVPEEMRAYAPVWEGLEMIRDPYTDAKSGKVRITMLMLFGFDIPRGTVTELRFKVA